MAAHHKGSGGLALPLTLALALALSGTALSGTAQAEPAGRITGIGGVFVKSKDPKALARWYRDVLGLPVEAWGGAMLRHDAPGHPPVAVWNAFPERTDYMAPSTREFMIDFAVDDLDAYLIRLKAKGVTILKRDDTDPTGKFAWILDPDGVKIELWEPKAP
jgi:catechol 2,3-dioxygenase-like lactoylglutathione lyase family enzyme